MICRYAHKMSEYEFGELNIQIVADTMETSVNDLRVIALSKLEGAIEYQAFECLLRVLRLESIEYEAFDDDTTLSNWNNDRLKFAFHDSLEDSYIIVEKEDVSLWEEALNNYR